MSWDDFVDPQRVPDEECWDCDRCKREINGGEWGVWFGEDVFNCRNCSIAAVHEMEEGIDCAKACLRFDIYAGE